MFAKFRADKGRERYPGMPYWTEGQVSLSDAGSHENLDGGPPFTYDSLVVGVDFSA